MPLSCTQKFYYPKDYSDWRDNLDTDQIIKKITEQKTLDLADKRYNSYAEALKLAQSLPQNNPIVYGATPKIGSNISLSQAQLEALELVIKEFIPWKKGPFQLFNSYIDSEWLSNKKWERLEGHLPNLKNKIVADIGCNNGYFLQRILQQKPKFAVGFEPYLKHYYHHLLWCHLIEGYKEQIIFEPLGIEHIHHFGKNFDVLFCLGILYHHTDPVNLLRSMKSTLIKGGQIIIDCQGVEGSESMCLVPKNKYCGASGIWFLPTLEALKNWIRRAGFSHINVIFDDYLSTDEQRTSKHAPIKSLFDYIDPKSSLTIEGYPPPKRFYLSIR